MQIKGTFCAMGSTHPELCPSQYFCPTSATAPQVPTICSVPGAFFLCVTFVWLFFVDNRSVRLDRTAHLVLMSQLNAPLVTIVLRGFLPLYSAQRASPAFPVRNFPRHVHLDDTVRRVLKNAHLSAQWVFSAQVRLCECSRQCIISSCRHSCRYTTVRCWL